MKKLNKLFMIPILSLGLSLMSCDLNKVINFGGSSSNESETSTVTGVSFTTKEVSLKVGETYQLSYEVLPSNAPNKEVSFSSNDYSKVTVSETGLLTAKKEGEATIQITTIDGGFTDFCVVTVTEAEPEVIPVTGVELNFEEIDVTIGSSLSLIASVLPNNADNQNVTWSSSNEDIVSVDENGKITGNALGEATVTVITEDGNHTASCVVSVGEEVRPVEGVSLNYEQFSLYLGKSFTLLATLEPYNATEQGLNWSSSDESVVTVEDGTINALAVGTANVTVETVDGGFTATCAVTVLEKDEETPYVPEVSDDVLIITEAGEFDVSQNYKQVYVNAPEAEVVLNLNGVTLENSENSPIYVEDCDSIDISAKKNTTNYINDLRSAYTEDVAGQGKGAIYVVNGDLKLKGTGTLYITANYYNGVHCKDDVKIQKQTLNVNAIHHAIKGNDSVTISSGTLNLSCGGDGIKTENTDISESTGKQRGNITINGGNITINSWGDAITAAYDVIIQPVEDSPEINLDIKTNKNSSYSGSLIEASESKLYLKMSSSTYSNGSYTYAAYINNQWYKAVYSGTQTTSSNDGGGWPGGPGGGGGPGGSSTYYIYEIERPVDATSFKLYRFSGSNVTSFSTSNYNAVSDQKAFNDSYDMVTISVRSGTISLSSWSNYDGGDISSKGIKAENEVNIDSGTISINAYDDGIHTNSDAALENGETPLGNINISGGDITIASDDDGIHADYTLNISGGSINITKSYEGLEANLIRISGGEIYAVASDDGVNAPNGKSTPNITVSGGLLDVTVPTGGDTDGIDSNGSFTQTGGVVITKGPGSASGSNGGGSHALDTDSTITISSGTLIVFGSIERTPQYSGTTRTLCSSSTVSAGSHTISFASASYTTTLTSSSQGCVVYSSLGSATLK